MKAGGPRSSGVDTMNTDTGTTGEAGANSGSDGEAHGAHSSSAPRVPWPKIAGGLLGLVLLAWILAAQDLGALAGAIRRAGWWLALVMLVEPLLWLSHALGWHLLFTPGRRPRFADSYAASALASAFNNLLPVFAVGGELLKARHLMQRGTPGAEVGAAGIADLSLHGVSALAWSLLGLLMLGQVASDPQVLAASRLGMVLIGGAVAALIGAQLYGSAALARWLEARLRRRGSEALAHSTGRAQAALLKIWRRRALLLLSILVRMAGRFVMVPELLFVAALMGEPMSLADAVLVTGLVVLVKTVSFIIPARIGVQEGTFVAAGMLLDQPGALMLGLALAVRLRETLTHLPVLALWYWSEWRRLLMRRGASIG